MFSTSPVIRWFLVEKLKGLPEKLMTANQDRLVRVPTTDKVRSLNLATTVGIAGFEVLRQVSRS